MKIGVPKEVKNHEMRVGLTPTSVQQLTSSGHQVFVQTNAGLGIGAEDTVYKEAGAEILGDAESVFEAAELIVKVKEPQPSERALLKPHHTLFTYLHLAPDAEQTKDLVDSGATCIAYETVTDDNGGLPLLAPMSAVAGRMSIQAAANYLEQPKGGAGLLIGGVPGVEPAKVVVIGGGFVGQNAAEMAIGLGGDVVVLDRNQEVLDSIAERWREKVAAVYSTPEALEELVVDADVVIGAVLIKGDSAPKLVTADMIKRMRPGSVVVDVAIDQGGSFETSKPTTHAEPVYEVDGVIHYCVTNMPGAVPKTSTYALNAVTIDFVQALADKGTKEALLADPHLLNGLNVIAGKVTEPSVAEELGYEYVDPKTALS